MPRRIFVDTEWTAAPWSDHVELVWIGLADEQGRSWHAVSSEVAIDPNGGLTKLIPANEKRIATSEITAGVLTFCGDVVDEIWAWIPPLDRFAAWFELGDDAQQIYDRYWNWDLQVLQSLVDPWPAGWPTKLGNLHDAAIKAGVEIPPLQENHLAPDVHASWNARLFALIREAEQRR